MGSLATASREVKAARRSPPWASGEWSLSCLGWVSSLFLICWLGGVCSLPLSLHFSLSVSLMLTGRFVPLPLLSYGRLDGIFPLSFPLSSLSLSLCLSLSPVLFWEGCLGIGMLSRRWGLI